jgi:hypothetical protein
MVPRICLQPDLAELQRHPEHERRAEHGMPREGQLERGCEDPNPRMAPGFGRQDEDRLGEVQLAGELLHGLVVGVAPVAEDGKLGAGQRHVGEDVRDDVAQGRHRSILYHDRVTRRP